MFVIWCYFYEFIIHSSYGEARVRRSRTLVEFNFLDERGSLGGVDNFEFSEVVISFGFLCRLKPRVRFGRLLHPT